MRLYTRVVVLLIIASLIISGCAAPQTSAPAEEPEQGPAPTATSEPTQPTATTAETAEEAASTEQLITVRFGSIAGASQSYIPILLRDQGIGEKWGFDVEIFELTTTGQQWTGMRTGDFDVSSGSSLDLLRQRNGGLDATAIRGFITFGNPIIASADAPYETLSDLEGARVGTPSTSLLDWMIIRTAGIKAQDFDIETDAEPTTAAPPLITELLNEGELDAAFQFSDFTLKPIEEGTVKEVTDVPSLMEQADLDPNAFYLTYNVSDQWREAHPDAVPRLIAAMDEAVELMMTDDSIWPGLAETSGVTDPDLLPAFIEMQREAFRTSFTREQIEPTQELVDELVEVVGGEPVGVTEVDPAAFDFESNEAAKELRK